MRNEHLNGITLTELGRTTQGAYNMNSAMGKGDSYLTGQLKCVVITTIMGRSYFYRTFACNTVLLQMTSLPV